MTEQELRAQYEQEMALYDQYQKEMRQQDFPVNESTDPNTYLEEVHPEVSTADRMIAKNFSKDPATTLKFLETRYPNMDITQRDGRIFLKNRSEKEFRAFDPEGWGQYLTSPMEALRDIGDVGYDVASGIGEGAAAAGSAVMALPSAPFTAGLGPLAAGVAGGGAAGGAAEILRQKAGQILGLPQEELDTEQVKMAALAGGASPLLFGTGAAVKGAVKGMTKEAAEQAQRGLLKRGYDVATEKAFPKAMEFMSGVPASATRSLAKNLDTVDELNAAGILPHAEAAQEMVTNTLKSNTTRVGKELEQAIKSVGENVNISKVKQTFKDHIAEVRKNAPKNQETAAYLQALQDKYDSIFAYEKPTGKINADGSFTKTGVKKVEMPDQISATQAFQLQDQLRDSADFFRVKGGPGESFSQTATRADKQGMGVARGAYGEINTELDRVTKGLSTELKGKYKDLINMKSKLQPMFKDPETTFRTLSNLGGKGRKTTYEILEGMDKSYGTNLMKKAEELQAYKYFGEPAGDAISSQGVTATARSMGAGALGGMAGYYAGQEMGLPAYVSMPLGTFLGAKAASPAMIKASVRGGKAAERVGRKVTPSARTLNKAAPSAWLMMDDRE